MKKIKENQFENYYEKTYLIITTLTIYFLTTLLKQSYYGLYNLSFEKFTQQEKLIATLVYQAFAISISMLFLVKNKNKTIEQLKKYTKIAGIGLLTIFIYSMTSLLELIILYYTKIDITKMSITAKSIYLITCELFIMIIIGIINIKKLKKDIKDIIKNFEEYYTKYLKVYILTLGIMIISNLIINSITQSIATNEEIIRSTLTKAPIYMYFSAVIFAPFTEEMVFRQAIKNIIPNKYAFIITSGLIFGGLHVIGDIHSLYDLLYIIPYSAPGIAFAYMLEKTDNIFVSMGIHFFHNGLLMTIQLIVNFL